MNKIFKEYSSEQGPDIEDLQEFILQTHQNLLADGNLVPVFAFHVGDQLNIAVIPDEIMSNKPLTAKALKLLITENKPDYYWFIAEGWAASCSEQDSEEHKQHVEDISNGGSVEKLPRNKRDEVVIINVGDARQDPPVIWLGSYSIIRDRQGEIHNFTPTRWLKNDKEKGIHLEGTFIL